MAEAINAVLSTEMVNFSVIGTRLDGAKGAKELGGGGGDELDADEEGCVADDGGGDDAGGGFGGARTLGVDTNVMCDGSMPKSEASACGNACRVLNACDASAELAAP